MTSDMSPSASAEHKAGEFREDLNNIVICPECKEDPPNLVEEFSDGDLVCGSCGMVLGDRIVDNRSEWRTFSNDDSAGDDPNRVGDAPNALIDGDQLQTTIAFEGGRNSKSLSHMQNKITHDKAAKALLEAYKNIQNFVDRMNAGSTVSNAAKHIYKLTEDNKVLKGKSQEAIIAGCIFIACRQSGVPRTFRELHSETKVSKKEIGRVFKQLEAFLQKIGGEESVVKASSMAPQTYVATGATNAVELCTRYCSRLDFRDRMAVENLARHLAEAARGISDLAGRSPLSVAAACIFMAASLRDEPRQSKRISQVAGVSDGTVKTAYRFLFAAKDKVIKPEWNVDLKNLPSN